MDKFRQRINRKQMNHFKLILNLQEIINYVYDAGTDSCDYYGGRFDGGYFVQQNPEEFAELIYYLQQTKKIFKNYLEIGSAAGGATRILHELLPIKNIIIIDDNQHPLHVHRSQNLNRIPHKEFIGNSHNVEAAAWLKSLKIKFDLIFIDGDHSYAGVKADTDLVLPFMEKGGLVLFHDSFCFNSISSLIKELKNDRRLSFLKEWDIAKVACTNGDNKKLGLSLFTI